MDKYTRKMYTRALGTHFRKGRNMIRKGIEMEKKLKKRDILYKICLGIALIIGWKLGKFLFV